MEVLLLKSICRNSIKRISFHKVPKMNLRSSPKRYEGYRSKDPSETINLLKMNFGKLGLHTIYHEERISSGKASLFSSHLKLKEIGFSTGGKGISSLLAKASAYAELAERFSTGLFYFLDFNHEDFYDRTFKLMERRFLRGFTDNFEESISFRDISILFDHLRKRQYDMFVENGLLKVGVDAYDPLHGGYIKVPIILIDFLSGSTGLASGNTIEEAIVQASCEIFERFAASKILSEEIVCPTLDIESIRNSKVKRYIDLFKKLNIDVVLKDFSLGNSVPVIAVLFVNRNFEEDENPLKRIFFYKMIDVGSAINLEEAILRALTERVQDLSRERLIRYREMDKLYYTWRSRLGKEINLGKEDFRFFSRRYILKKDLSFLERGQTIGFKDLPSEFHKDFLDDCKSIFNICENNGWEISIVDFTHKILDFPTVRVIIRPISIACDPFVRSLINIYNDRERFDFFYGIRNFYHYVNDDNWIHEKEEVEGFIECIEEYLSFNLPFYHISIDRGMFRQQINLLYLLGRLYALLGRFRIAMTFYRLSKTFPSFRRKNPLGIKPHGRIEKRRKAKILEKVVDSFF